MWSSKLSEVIVGLRCLLCYYYENFSNDPCTCMCR